MSEEKKQETKETKTAYGLVKVPTGEMLAVQTPSGEVITFEELVVTLANKVHELETIVK